MTSLIHNGFTQHKSRVQLKVEKIREIMKSQQKKKDGSTLEELIIIDAIQRLGLEYYFKGDIQEALERQFAIWQENFDDDLHVTAIRFRLLRQQGYNVSPDIFKKFKNEDDGKFKEELSKDMKGLLSLFEACQLSFQGEDILDEGIEFSEQLLKALASLYGATDQPRALMIENTLKNSHHKSFATRFLAKDLHFLEFLHDVVDKRDWMDEVLDLAAIDFEMVQRSWRKEILQVARWGQELNSAKKLEFARIRPTKWFMWPLGTLPWPEVSQERIELAKAVSFIYIIDDVFDIHGTLDELSLFTQVLNRWEHGDTKLLPDYMKVCVKALYAFTNEFSLKIYQKCGWNPKSSLVKTWVDLCNSFLVEAKWFASGQFPDANKYLKNGIISSGIHVVLMHAFFLLGEQVNQKTVDEMNSLPPIVSSTATIVRLWNDVGTDKDPNRDGTDGSYMDCYLNEHKECSARNVRQLVNQMINDAWKCLNQESMSQTSLFSPRFRAACINFARMVPIMYNHDAQNHRQCLEKLLKRLLNGCPN